MNNIRRLAAASMACVLTLSMLLGIDLLARTEGATPLLVQAGSTRA
jgi:hypothetical protein